MPQPRIVFVNRYFHPDHSATSQMLQDLAFHLVGRGFEVEVVTSRQIYDQPDAMLPPRDSVRGVSIRRVRTTRFGRDSLPGRFLDALTFFLSAFAALLIRLNQSTIVISMTDPPLISAAAAAAVQLRGGILINWVQDLFPEIAEELAVLRRGGIASRTLRAIRNYSLREAVTNVAIGALMEQRLRRRGGDTALIPNWSDPDIHPIPPETNPLRKELALENAFVVGYSGNLGRVHDHRSILGAIRELRSDPRIRFVITGSGIRYQTLKARAETEGLENVIFRPYQPRALLSESLSLPDIHLVTLIPSVEGLVVPSKFYGIAAAGRPTLFIGRSDGEIATLISETECGVVVPFSDPLGLAQAIRSLAGEPERLLEMGQRARTLYEAELTPQLALQDWEELLAGIAREQQLDQSETARHPSSRISWIAIPLLLLLLGWSARLLPVPNRGPTARWIPAKEQLQTGRPQLAAAIRDNPADWRSAAEIADQALDYRIEKRKELWRAAHSMSRNLVRTWDPPQIPFIRSGFAHWNELDAAERLLVLEETERLLHDPDSFTGIYYVVWQVTRDIRYLMRNRPDRAEATRQLEVLAARNGEFEAYRELRSELTRQNREEFIRLKRQNATPEEMLSSLLRIERTEANNQVIEEYLRFFVDNPPTGSNGEPAELRSLADYLLRHELKPLKGLVEIEDSKLPLPTRAWIAFQAGQLARAGALEEQWTRATAVEWSRYYATRAMNEALAANLIGAQQLLGKVPIAEISRVEALVASARVANILDDEHRLASIRNELAELFGPATIDRQRWQGLCGSELCPGTPAWVRVYSETPATVPVTVHTTESDEVDPYVEIRLDDRLVKEGPVKTTRTFEVQIAPDRIHRIDARLVNPATRNLKQRRAEIVFQ